MSKIYVIGPVSSGKTTLANTLAKKLNIKMYELDKVVWDDDNGNIKRSDEDIAILFLKIIRENSWIIEDVGRSKFIDGVKNADVVYYIDLNKFVLYKRCILRWVKQKLGLMKYNYKPTLKDLFNLLSWINKDVGQKEEKIKYLKENAKKVIILNKKEIKKLINS